MTPPHDWEERFDDTFFHTTSSVVNAPHTKKDIIDFIRTEITKAKEEGAKEEQERVAAIIRKGVIDDGFVAKDGIPEDAETFTDMMSDMEMVRNAVNSTLTNILKEVSPTNTV